MRRGELPAVITRLMSKCPWSEWKWWKGYKEIASLPLHLLSCKLRIFVEENRDRETKIKREFYFTTLRKNFCSMMSEECRNSFMTEVPIIYFIVVICKNFRFASTINSTNNKLLLWLTLIQCHICTSCHLTNYSSRATASGENCLQNLILTLNQTLTHTEGQFCSGKIVQTPEIT